MKISCLIILFYFALMHSYAQELKEQTAVIEIGKQRELFVDHYLIDTMTGSILELHEPRHQFF